MKVTLVYNWVIGIYRVEELETGKSLCVHGDRESTYEWLLRNHYVSIDNINSQPSVFIKMNLANAEEV